MPPKSSTTKHIFVTGGVASSLGKGLTASSLGMLLKARGLRVVMQKLDPYLNVDPGTMNPFQHGEVFVTNDGAETDLDIGHYERFLDRDLDGSANVTTGQVYNTVIAKERRGEYLGDTVQVIPHITNEIKHRIRRMATDEVDVVITEVGGTVGDIESLPFLETVRQVRHEVGRDNVFVVHISLLPYIGPSGELKTKPTQHSVAALRNIGIQPDAIVLRCDREVPTAIKRKISLMCDVDEAAVVACPDARSIYDIPKVVHTEGLDAYVVRKLDLPFRDVDWTTWDDLLDRVHKPEHEIVMALVGKYIDLPDAYLSVTEALRAGGFANKARVKIKWVTSDDCKTPAGAKAQLGDVDAICIPGGFGERGVTGKVGAIKYARENKIPLLGLCLGLQCIVVEGRAQPGRCRGRQLHRVRPRHRAPGRLDHGRAAGHRGRGRRHGRHHAARHVPGEAGRGLHRARGLRRQGVRRGAAPPPLRGEQRLPRGAGEEGRHPLLGHLPGRQARRVRRVPARRPPLPGRHAGAPGAALAPDPPAPALRRAGQGRGRAEDVEVTHQLYGGRGARTQRRGPRLSRTSGRAGQQ
ncbi:CTP synthase [Streptomyces ambofaciens]